jgi:hypothetical protein
MLLEELSEGRYGNIESVAAKVVFDLSDSSLLVQPAGRLEAADQWLGLGIDLVLKGAEGLGLGVVAKSSLLEEE